MKNCPIFFLLTCFKADVKKQASYWKVALEELKDIMVGLDQRISVYKSRLQDLQKKRERLTRIRKMTTILITLD